MLDGETQMDYFPNTTYTNADQFFNSKSFLPDLMSSMEDGRTLTVAIIKKDVEDAGTKCLRTQ